MDFNSPIFLFLFLPAFYIFYYIAPARAKIVLGIIGSLLFYAWGHLRYVPLLLALAVLTYLLGLGIERWREKTLASIFLWGGILVNILLLILFKVEAVTPFPLGLSFLTFQIIAYLVEVRNKVIEAEKEPLAFFFYLLLFPKIPVGPITRYRDLRAQIREIQVTPADAADGLRRFIRGLAKKTLIADTLGWVVTPIFALETPAIAPSIAWLVIIAYALQLFFDFSGYIDMANGLGRMMGFRFMENFNYPYISKNIGEFWRRWHISLSNWFRDMVFYPLERRRFKFFGQQFNILVVFLLTGLWHGISVNFVVWGLIHGLALVFEATPLGRRLRSAWTPIQHLYALGVILVGWVFFRSPTLEYALLFLRRLLGSGRGVETLPFELTSPLPFIEPTFLLALFAAILLSMPIGARVEAFVENLSKRGNFANLFLRLASDVGHVALLIASLAAVAASDFIPAIYGNF